MTLGTKKRETRKINASARLDHARRRLCGASMRGAGPVDIGAKLTIDDRNTLPAKLRLAFSRDARTGRNCEVSGRRGKTVGIKFVR